jgi:hypothetical protein
MPIAAGRGRARRPRAHFLHIGKTGGSALKAALQPVAQAGRYELMLHQHWTRLDHVPAGDKLFFVIRDPVDRFVSGFNSRQRRGLPRYEVPWTPEEALAFEEFTSADSLGRALFSSDPDLRWRARRAMTSIGHVRTSYWHWFHHRYAMEKRAGDLLLAIWFDDLSRSLPRLSELLGLPDTLVLAADEVTSHRSPARVDRALSDAARTNLEHWYEADYAFLDQCSELDCFSGPPHLYPEPEDAASAMPTLAVAEHSHQSDEVQ